MVATRSDVKKLGPHISGTYNSSEIETLQVLWEVDVNLILELYYCKETALCHNNVNIHHRSYLWKYNRSEVETIGRVWWEVDAYRYS